MQRPGPGQGVPAVAGQQHGPFFCFTGTLNLLPAPKGAVLGQLVTTVGVGVPLVQSAPLAPGIPPLVTLNHQVATVGGRLCFYDELLALDVLYVSPGVNTRTPGVSPLALLHLSLLGLLPTAD